MEEGKGTFILGNKGQTSRKQEVNTIFGEQGTLVNIFLDRRGVGRRKAQFISGKQKNRYLLGGSHISNVLLRMLGIQSSKGPIVEYLKIQKKSK